MTRNSAGADIVIGAKGSPLQLVLSSVYHLDVPNGNIPQAEAERISRHPQIENTVPLALGDNYQGFRIVGTTEDYLELYSADIEQGRVFDAPFEAVAGSATGLQPGQKFAGAHGFAEDGEVHDEHVYIVTGVLQPTGTIMDRLIVTSVESVQKLHAGHDHDNHHEHRHHDHKSKKTDKEITALLVQVRSPMAVMSLPREINRASDVMAASPAYEMTRLSRAIGFSRNIFNGLAALFSTMAVIMVMALLAAGLAARRYDIAVLRVLGASRTQIASAVVIEGMLISFTGAVLGLIAGHIVAYGIAMHFTVLSGMVLPADILMPGMLDGMLLMAAVFAGAFAGAVPAWLAARTDIATVLARSGA